MSRVFFHALCFPEPDYYLDVRSGTHAEQTARVMLALEPVVLREEPDLVVVVGDVNSTVAAALVAAKLRIPVAHVEAGLRSRDRAMPEELNRLLTDQLADLLFTTSRDADANLVAEAVPPDRIFFVGNTMIDTLDAYLSKARESSILSALGLAPSQYAVTTLHRPSNVDDDDDLGAAGQGSGPCGREIAGGLSCACPYARPFAASGTAGVARPGRWVGPDEMKVRLEEIEAREPEPPEAEKPVTA